MLDRMGRVQILRSDNSQWDEPKGKSQASMPLLVAESLYSRSPLLCFPPSLLVDAIAPYLSDTDIVRLACTCRSLSWLTADDRTAHCHHISNKAALSASHPPQTFLITIPWRRRCRPPFARLPAGNVLGDESDPTTWACLSHVLSALPSFGPSLPPPARLNVDPRTSPPESEDDQGPLRRFLQQAAVLTILRGLDLLPHRRGDNPDHAERPFGRTFEAWFQCDPNTGGDDCGAVDCDFFSAAQSYSGGVIMGFQSVGDKGFISANLHPRLSGLVHYHIRVPLLVVDPISGCVRSTITNQVPFRNRKDLVLTGGSRVTDGRWHHAALRLEVQSAGVLRRATLFVDGMEVDAGEPPPIFTRGCVTVGTGAVRNPFSVDPPNSASRIIALPFKGKIVAARAWGRPVRDIRALFEMRGGRRTGSCCLGRRWRWCSAPANGSRFEEWPQSRPDSDRAAFRP
ncbi:hypothetical protein DFJ73DRAFT_401580 [Zopfochytrium polystomum]|nr:hypothetical protein DFJ73DRAFT_401580 [Zopfochytrium polystomum]